MRQYQLNDGLSAEEIGIWGSVAGELERLRDTARHSELTLEERLNALINSVSQVNEKLEHLDQNLEKKRKAKAQKLAHIRNELERLMDEPPALRKEAFGIWWGRFAKEVHALAEAVPDDET